MKHTCVDDETIMDYLQGRLKRRARERVEKHLCDCDNCRELFILAAEVIHNSEVHQVEPVSLAVTQRAVEAVEAISKKKHNRGQRLILGSRRVLTKGRLLLKDVISGPMPQPVALRGDGEASGDDLSRDQISVYGIDTIIEINKTTATHFTITIALTSHQLLDTPLRVGLFAEASELASVTLVDEVVYFEEIPCGKYELVFSHANQQLHVYTIDV